MLECNVVCLSHSSCASTQINMQSQLIDNVRPIKIQRDHVSANSFFNTLMAGLIALEQDTELSVSQSQFTQYVTLMKSTS